MNLYTKRTIWYTRLVHLVAVEIYIVPDNCVIWKFLDTIRVKSRAKFQHSTLLKNLIVSVIVQTSFAPSMSIPPTDSNLIELAVANLARCFAPHYSSRYNRMKSAVSLPKDIRTVRNVLRSPKRSRLAPSRSLSPPFAPSRLLSPLSCRPSPRKYLTFKWQPLYSVITRPLHFEKQFRWLTNGRLSNGPTITRFGREPCELCRGGGDGSAKMPSKRIILDFDEGCRWQKQH